LARANQYKYQVVNDTVDRAVAEIGEILKKLGIVATNN
jgi:guanylate kinase